MPEKKEAGYYKDIIHLTRPISSTHAPMPMRKRAAQFSPFKALDGYEETIEETGRLTCPKSDLDEDEKEALDVKLAFLEDRLSQGEHPSLSVTLFIPDHAKPGGEYVTRQGLLKAFDPYRRLMILTEDPLLPSSRGIVLPLKDIRFIDGNVFKNIESF